ncbi:MAG TPA: hypothetical protein VE326_11110 [Candidatus Binatia bacterium]|nr:hypothetical protein [Candidatus Binatia bacterium]
MKSTIANAGHYMSRLTAFVADNLRAETLFVLSGMPETGKLPGPYASALRDAQSERKERYLTGEGRNAAPHAPMYVVFSYGTPIAWVTIAGSVVIPDVRYSATTSRHQKLAREALSTIAPEHLRAMQASNDYVTP